MAEEDYCKCGKKLISNLEIAQGMCYSCMEDRTAAVVNAQREEE